jgi:DNA-3-methyladenine glycosylase
MVRSPLPVSFYDRPVEQVARDLLGSRLCVDHGEIWLEAVIVETEAYGGPEDLASHAAFRRTGLVRYMHGPPGTFYIYAAYGMYPCLNLVTGPHGDPSAVLIRAASITEPEPDDRTASGPGRLGRAIGLSVDHNGLLATDPPFWISGSSAPPGQIASGPRVGVKRGDHRHWRFAIVGHPAVSRPRL